MITSPLTAQVLFHIGPVPITEPVVVTWGLMAALTTTGLLGTHKLRLDAKPVQATLELLISAVRDQIRETMRNDPEPYLPFLATLFIFIVSANLLALLPGVEPPTAHLETDAALAIIVFLAVHYFGVRARGLGGYLADFAKPTWIMLPLNLLSEVTRTFSLMVRLFGNIMSGVFIIGIVLSLVGLLVPIPFMALELLTGLIQAYIFTVLAMVFIGGAVGHTPSSSRSPR
ncbi:F-type H+-transporting ATPase subunit a [Phenylobacterium haematophilum]|jgi:F-type H+-transporting ATPase subunit a|uniref:ATP synthase subunit a n=1 Tax=Phenylobacterium haematophilum TaxID=98513 RepID=A0A840A2W0_9CAUL|nr:F0F1 ATP synthase subunit A [Phenylobacterium haematophilum]MBB3892966.1 F-type H+-transporting ATPase subunit a [Phenylobacterium haematophilum]